MKVLIVIAVVCAAIMFGIGHHKQRCTDQFQLQWTCKHE